MPRLYICTNTRDDPARIASGELELSPEVTVWARSIKRAARHANRQRRHDRDSAARHLPSVLCDLERLNHATVVKIQG
jgi:hypothetical protein